LGGRDAARAASARTRSSRRRGAGVAAAVAARAQSSSASSRRPDFLQRVPEESVGDRRGVGPGRRRHLPDRVRVNARDGVARFVDGCGGEQPHSGVDPLPGRVDPDLSGG